MCEGYVTNVLNPAIATFYLVVLPQFIPRGAPIVRSVLVLTAVHRGSPPSAISALEFAAGGIRTVAAIE